MRILHCFLILAFAILLKNVYCDSTNNPIRLPSSPDQSYLSLFPKPKASPFKVPATIDEVRRRSPPPPRRSPPPPRRRPPPPQRPPPPPPSVASYILAVTWPPGACTGNSGIRCAINPVPTEFKIHGLWPNPNGLPATETYHPNTIATLTSRLNNHWPNLRSAQQQVSINLIFWGHEWNDHGKYSEMGVRAYFEKTLELFENVGQRLRANLVAERITPNLYNTYKLQDIEAALRRINGGFSCTIICNQRNTSKRERQIQEIRFRFNKNFQKLNNVASSTCGTADTEVMFPA